MEHAKLMEQVIADSSTIIKRRINMLGQHLSNIGFEDVDVCVSIEVKVKEPNGSGISIQKIEGTYKKYQPGFGPADIKGNGTLVDVDGMITTTAPAATPASSPLPSSVLASAAGNNTGSIKSVWQRP